METDNGIPFPSIELKKDILITKVGNRFLLHKENELIGDDGQNVWWRCLVAGPKKETNLRKDTEDPDRRSGVTYYVHYTDL